METRSDYLVIGGGSGGLASAKRAAAHGARTVLVEAGRLGGTCVNVGCVPKKIMWNAATLADHLADAPDYGFDVEVRGFDWARLKAGRDATVARLNGVHERALAVAGVELVRGLARFVDGHTVEVAGERYTADHILIATGGRPTVPNLPGAELGITSDGFFELEELPKRVAIVGAGYIAVELAGVLHALGSEVSLLLRHAVFLRPFDALIRDTLMEEMSTAGVNILSCIHLESVRRESDGRLCLVSRDGTPHPGYDCLLWAAGRTPLTAELGLERTEVTTDAEGQIVVDAYERTTAPDIHALGDVTGRVRLTPVAIAAGRKLADRLFGGDPDAHLDYENIASVIFAHPPAATVGLTEDEACERYGRESVKAYTSRFVGLYHTLTERKSSTAMKIVTIGRDERVVGIHVVGAGADELIQGFAVAVTLGATKADLDRTVAVHPTTAEELVLMR